MIPDVLSESFNLCEAFQLLSNSTKRPIIHHGRYQLVRVTFFVVELLHGFLLHFSHDWGFRNRRISNVPIAFPSHAGVLSSRGE
jgi:hypothetical protein